MGEEIQRVGRTAWALIGLGVLLAASIGILWWARPIWAPGVLAGGIVFILHPIVCYINERGIPRFFAVLGVYLLTVAAFVGTIFAVVPVAVDQYEGLQDDFPRLEQELKTWVNDISEQSQDWPIAIPNWNELENTIENTTKNTSAEDNLNTARTIGGQVFHTLFIILVAPILAFYILLDLPRIQQRIRRLVPPEHKDEISHLTLRLSSAIGGFFRGQLFVALFVGVTSSIGLRIIGLPFWLVIGMIAGLFNLAPLIGPWIGAIPGVVIAMTTEEGINKAIAVVIVMVVVQQVDNHIISPLVMKRAVRIHPAVVMIALIIGGSAGGILGLVIAVPVTAVFKILGGHLWRRNVLGWTLEKTMRDEEEEDSAPGKGIVLDVTKDTNVLDRRSGSDRRGGPRPGTEDRRAVAGRRAYDHDPDLKPDIEHDRPAPK